MFDALTEAYHASSETYIQLLIERFNGIMMNETDNVIEHVNKMSIIAKELVVLGNPIPDKMQVSTILHSLPGSWDFVVVALNYSATPMNMKNLPTLLGIEAERRNKKNTSKSLLTIASTSQPLKNETPKNDKKKFSKNFKGKGKNLKNNDKNKRGKGKCFKCGKIGHYQANRHENKNN